MALPSQLIHTPFCCGTLCCPLLATAGMLLIALGAGSPRVADAESGPRFQFPALSSLVVQGRTGNPPRLCLLHCRESCERQACSSHGHGSQFSTWVLACICSGLRSFVSELSRKRIMLVWQEDHPRGHPQLQSKFMAGLGTKEPCLINKRWVRMGEWIKVLAARSQWDPRSGRREPAPTVAL